MIKFFRKIRQKLLSENKFRKYLIYAIGEIVLVVIGILIALQINNKNDERKDRIKEKIILQGLVSDLKTNRNLIEKGLNDYQENKELSQNMAKLIGQEVSESNIALMDSLIFWTAEYTSVELINSSIITLTTSDKLELLTNENLKQKIVEYPIYIELYREREDLVRSIVINKIRPNIEKYISMQKWLENLPKTFQSDYNELFNDRQLSNSYINRIFQINGSVHRLENLRIVNDSLIEIIKSELEYRFE